MAIIQSIPLRGSGCSYIDMTTEEAIDGTNTEERVISAKVLNDAIDNKIPTVNNAKLTIQKNGTTVKTFTANAGSDVTCNIEVPTKVSDLTNDSGFLTEHQDISNKADKATTLSGYGITDAYTKTQVDKKVSDLVNSAPETLDTLNELANALGNDPNFATTVSNQIGNKADNDKVVHTSGDETVNGVKDFTSSQKMKGLIINPTGTIHKEMYGNTEGAIGPYGAGDVPESNTNPFRFYVGKARNYTSAPIVFDTGMTPSGGTYITLRSASNESENAVDHRVNISTSVTDNSDGTKTKNAYVQFYNTNELRSNKNNYCDLGTESYKWKNVYATTFNGTLVGNADTATTATNNASGNELSNDIIKGLSVSGKVITYTKLDGSTGTITTQDTNTTYNVATTSANGLMSSTDKTKLDGLSNYTLPTASSTLGGVKTTSTVTSTSGLTACPIISGVPYYKDTNNTYSFSNNAPTLAWGTTSTIGTVGGTVLTVTMPANPNTDTHWTTTLYAGAKDAKSNAATTNGNTYIKLYDNSTVRSQLNIKGSGATTVTTDADGVITINSTDTNTTYSKLSQFTNDSGYITGITKAMVTTALGYTPPTSDTNTWTALKGSTTSAAGTAGYAPAPAAGDANRYLRCDGTWQVPPDNNTTYSFTNKAATLAWNTTSTIATVGGVDITVKLPANPNTDTTYSAGTNMSLSGTTFATSSTPSFSNVTVTNDSSNGVLFGPYRVYVG